MDALMTLLSKQSSCSCVLFLLQRIMPPAPRESLKPQSKLSLRGSLPKVGLGLSLACPGLSVSTFVRIFLHKLH